MTNIEQMIKDMCPNGVEWKYLTDVANVLYGYPFEAEKFSEDESNIPLIRIRDVVPAKASTYYTGTYPKEYIIKAGDILVGMDGNFNLEKWKDRDGLLNQRVCKIYSKNADAVLDNFLYHLLKPLFKKIEDEIKGGTVKHLSAARIKQIEIPLPPLEIQKKIVECLEKFSALAAELQAELQMRRKQYEYYRTHLLTPHSESNSADKSDDAQWEWKTLGEVGEMIKGSGIQKSDFVEEGGKPCIHYGQVHTYYGTFAYKNKSFISDALYAKCKKAHTGDLIIATTSEDVEACCKATAWLGNEDVAVSGDAHIFRHTQNPKYMAYLFQTEMFAQQKRKCATGAKVTRVNGASMLKFRFPFPPLEEQERVVNFLDKFEVLLNSLSDGIPAEQILQQKRYEYYRDLLLTFPRKEV